MVTYTYTSREGTGYLSGELYKFPPCFSLVRAAQSLPLGVMLCGSLPTLNFTNMFLQCRTRKGADQDNISNIHSIRI